jgi:phage repressor protein C with HTH and peptisase S24 domain
VSIGERLKSERERLRFTQVAFAELGETTRKSQLDYEKNLTQPKAGYMAAIAKVGADIQYIITGLRSCSSSDELHAPELMLSKGQKTPNNSLVLHPIVTWDNEDELDPDLYVFIPVLDIKLSAGNGNVVWEVNQKTQRQAFLRSWAKRIGVDPSNAAIMMADGSSMEPRILDGDSLVVDYERIYINEGKIYAFALDGEVFVKRIHKEIGGALRISSDNTDKGKYPDKLIPSELVNQVHIIGRVMAVCGGV